MSDDQTKCRFSGCEKAARMALQSNRRPRNVLRTEVFWDNRTAPIKAQWLCKQHGTELLAEMVGLLVDPDAVERGDPTGRSADLVIIDDPVHGPTQEEQLRHDLDLGMMSEG